MQPFTISAGSAMPPCGTTSWYQAAKSFSREVMGESAIRNFQVTLQAAWKGGAAMIRRPTINRAIIYEIMSIN
jgi:hypothetical protein